MYFILDQITIEETTDAPIWGDSSSSESISSFKPPSSSESSHPESPQAPSYTSLSSESSSASSIFRLLALQMSSPIPVHQQSRLSRSWGTILISMSNRVRCALMPKLPPCIISTYMLSRTGWMCHPFLMMLLCQDLPSVRYEDVLPNMMMILPSRQILLS